MSLPFSTFYPDPIPAGLMSGAVGSGPSLAWQLEVIFGPAAAPGERPIETDGLDELFEEVEQWFAGDEEDKEQ